MGTTGISLNKIDDFVNCIYAIELEIKHSTDTSKFTSYHDLHLDIGSENPLRTVFYVSIKYVIMGTTGSGILDQLRDMYST
jgi:hypothetical protein